MHKGRTIYQGGGGGGLWFFFSFRIFFSDNTRVGIFFFLSRKAQIFFPEFNISLYDKNSESDFFLLHQNQNIFSATLGIAIYFQKKTIAPPWKLNGPSLMYLFVLLIFVELIVGQQSMSKCSFPKILKYYLFQGVMVIKFSLRSKLQQDGEYIQ